MMEFPKDFFWGAATSAYQVEGNNIYCDWWEWEKRVGLKEASGPACQHYQRYKEDFDLAKGLNHNAHRLSIEWSRIEPEQGQFSTKEIDHYVDVILSLRERNLEPIVTLHHFTNPLWFAKLGGWQNRNTLPYFLRYVEKIVHALSDKVRFWVTINEPMVYVHSAYIVGSWPPQERSFLKAHTVINNLLNTHIKAYNLIHNIYSRKGLSSPLVSIAKNMLPFVPCNLNLKNKFSAFLRNRSYNLAFIEKLIRHRSLDFVGVNYYTRHLVDVEKWSFRSFMLDVCQRNHQPLKKNSLGWDIYPEGLYRILLRLKKYNLPIFILENGICTEDDNARWDFIYQHLKNLHLAMSEGVRVLGYIYWSLIDNFEWDKGFGPRFGLAETDYNTYKRTARDSAKRFCAVSKTGVLD
ncbi:MAG: glycoside hydrolase family 1 protein [Candidatus Omnitrophica bacterium]|nr:glycoside hydrolase family 1 protein [Candidatus Omnitrophota bacterium]